MPSFFDQALAAYRAGLPFRELLVEHHRQDLLRYKASDVVTAVRILTAIGQACPACELMHDRVYTLQQALAEMPLPHADCSTRLRKKDRPGWCRCTYVAQVD